MKTFFCNQIHAMKPVLSISLYSISTINVDEFNVLLNSCQYPCFSHTSHTLSSIEAGFKVFILSEISLSILLLGTVETNKKNFERLRGNVEFPPVETEKDFPLFTRLVIHPHEPLHRLAECPVRSASGRARLPVEPRAEPLLCHHVAN